MFNTDDPTYGGSGFTHVDMASSQPYAWNGQENSIEIAVPGLAGLVYRRARKSSYVPPKPKAKAKTKAKSAGKTAQASKAVKAAQAAEKPAAKAATPKKTAAEPKAVPKAGTAAKAKKAER